MSSKRKLSRDPGHKKFNNKIRNSTESLDRRLAQSEDSILETENKIKVPGYSEKKLKEE